MRERDGMEREGVALERWEGLYDCVMKNTISAELCKTTEMRRDYGMGE